MAHSIFTSLSWLRSSAPVVSPAQQPTIHPPVPLIEKWAIVTQTIRPQERGRVQFAGSDWFGACHSPVLLLPGTPVRVTSISNITLIVEPILELRLAGSIESEISSATALSTAF
jgi:membrane protein implicated in regulation of membrane protease activity